MSDSNRAALAALVAATVDTPHVYAEALTIDSEDAAVALFGDGIDGDGRALLCGWWLPPCHEGRSRWLTARGGMTTDSRAYRIRGYRSRVDGQEELAEDDALALEAALLEYTTQASLRVDPQEGVSWEIHAAALTGFPVWETTLTVWVKVQGG